MTTMRIDLTVDDSGLRAMVADLTTRGLAYATVNAINNVAKLIQKVEVEQVHKGFTVRDPKFIDRQAAIIKPFANVKQNRPYAEVGVGQVKRFLLSVYETGGDKVSPRGAKLVGVPVTGGPARLNFATPVAETLYLRKLKFRAVRSYSKKNAVLADLGAVVPATIQFKGDNRMFLLKRTKKSFYGGVFQRVGPSRDDIRMVYSFKQRPHLRAMLHFYRTADTVAQQWLAREFKEQLTIEIARSQRRAG